MEILKNEIQKCFIKQRILYGTIFIIIIYIFATVIDLKKAEINLNETELNIYINYLEELQGELTTEKEKIYIKERDNNNSIVLELNRLQMKFFNGEITKEIFIKEYEKLKEELPKTAAIKLLNKQYEYVKESPETRWILSNCSWNCLMEEASIDYVLVVFLIISTYSYIACEKRSNISDVILTSKNNNRLVLCKLIIMMVFSAGLTLSVQLLRIFIFILKCGIENYHFPIQSLLLFETSNYNISIIGIFLLGVILKIIGSIYIVSITLLMISLNLSITSILFVNFVVIVGPQILVVDKSTIFKLPVPYGFLKGYGYFMGENIVIRANEIGEEFIVYLFRDISIQMILINTFISIVIIVICILVFVEKAKNKLTKKKARKQLGVVFMCISIILFSGCSKSDLTKINTPYINKNDKIVVINNNEYYIENNNIYISSKGEKKNILPDTFFENIDNSYQLLSLYSYDEYLFCLAVNGNNRYLIVQIDLNKYTKEIVYQSDNYFEYKYWNSLLVWNEDLNAYDDFFMNDRKIFLVSSDGIIKQIDRMTLQQKVIINENFKPNIIFIKDKIIYNNHDFQLKIYDTNVDSLHIVDELVYKFSLSEKYDYLIYETLLNEKRIEIK